MANTKKKRSLTLILRNYFITGVVVLIPIGFTLYLSKILIGLSSKIIPENINPNNYLPFAIPGVEIIISLILITFVGGLSLSFLEKRILKLNDKAKIIPKYVATPFPPLNFNQAGKICPIKEIIALI